MSSLFVVLTDFHYNTTNLLAQQKLDKFRTQGQAALSTARRPVTVGGMRRKTRKIENRIHRTIKNFLSQ